MNTQNYKLAALQMTSSDQLEENLQNAKTLIQSAVDLGAELLVLPENFALMANKSEDYIRLAEPLHGSGPIQDFLREQAARHQIWLVGGTLPIQSGTAGRPYSTALVFDNTGTLRGYYHKIHLFDVSVPERNERHCESDSFLPGQTPLLIDSPWGQLGIAICYDIRFPELFRHMSHHGLDILAIPAAFTATTGAAHWQVLLRARAIENLCYVIAAAQSGTHRNGRKTFGHSMVIDYWGQCLSCLEEGPGVAIAETDFAKMASVRTEFPVLRHRRS